MPKRSISKPVGLFLDGSGNVGWALMGIDLSTPLLRFDTFKTPPGDTLEMMGRRLHLIDVWLDAMVKRYKPALIGFESPFIPQFNAAPKDGRPQRYVNVATLRFLISVDGIFELVATRNGVPCVEIHNATVKATFAGSGRAQKVDIKRECWRRGWEIRDEHQADACGIGYTIIKGRLGDGGGDSDSKLGAGGAVRPVAGAPKPKALKSAPLII